MLEELKKQVVKYALQADRSGLCKHRSGNFSVRDPKTGYVCITPTGMDREEMTYHDVVVIDLDANVIEAETAQRRPTSESLMHLEVYKQHPDINAVAHTHSKYATAFAVLKKPLPAVVYEILGLGCKEGIVPVAAFGGAFGTAGYFVYDSIADLIRTGKQVQINSNEVLNVILVEPIDVPVI